MTLKMTSNYLKTKTQKLFKIKNMRRICQEGFKPKKKLRTKQGFLLSGDVLLAKIFSHSHTPFTIIDNLNEFFVCFYYAGGQRQRIAIARAIIKVRSRNCFCFSCYKFPMELRISKSTKLSQPRWLGIGFCFSFQGKLIFNPYWLLYIWLQENNRYFSI